MWFLGHENPTPFGETCMEEKARISIWLPVMRMCGVGSDEADGSCSGPWGRTERTGGYYVVNCTLNDIRTVLKVL